MLAPATILAGDKDVFLTEVHYDGISNLYIHGQNLCLSGDKKAEISLGKEGDIFPVEVIECDGTGPLDKITALATLAEGTYRLVIDTDGAGKSKKSKKSKKSEKNDRSDEFEFTVAIQTPQEPPGSGVSCNWSGWQQISNAFPQIWGLCSDGALQSLSSGSKPST